MSDHYDDDEAIPVKKTAASKPGSKFTYEQAPIPRMKIPAQPFNPAKRNKQYTPK